MLCAFAGGTEQYKNYTKKKKSQVRELEMKMLNSRNIQQQHEIRSVELEHTMKRNNTEIRTLKKTAVELEKAKNESNEKLSQLQVCVFCFLFWF